MSIKRILVPLPGTAEHAGEIDIALAAGKAFGAHVEALFISEPPQPPRVSIPASDYYGRGATAVARVNPFAEERERIASAARETFTRACFAANIPILDANQAVGSPPFATWRVAEGAYVDVAVQRAAAFDLVVAASAAVRESLKEIAEGSLLRTRRPVLLAPESRDAKLTDPALIAWDESAECWHAVSAAVPFLKLARAITVVSVDRHAEYRRASQAEVVAYLRCHGIEAKAEVVAPQLRSIAETLLAVARDHNAGLLVMGAYSHSRLRELLLGGATRHVLRNAAGLPVLMAH